VDIVVYDSEKYVAVRCMMTSQSLSESDQIWLISCYFFAVQLLVFLFLLLL